MHRTWEASGMSSCSRLHFRKNEKKKEKWGKPQGEGRDHKNFWQIAGQTSSSHSQYKLVSQSMCFEIWKKVLSYFKSHTLRDQFVRAFIFHFSGSSFFCLCFHISGIPFFFLFSSSQTSVLWINLVSILWCSSPPRNPVYPRRVDPSAVAFSLSSHRHSYISLLFISRFIT
jgi:hypothetical protein